MKSATFNKPFLRGWRAVTVALLFLLIPVCVNLAVVFQEGWAFHGLPNHYLYPALKNQFDLHAESDRFLFKVHPLHGIGKLIGSLAEPTPPWYRLTGSVFLCLLFLAAYSIGPGNKPNLDRLLTAVMLCSTPVVFYTSRFFDDHIFHLLILTVAAGLLIRRFEGGSQKNLYLFFLLPAIDLWGCLTTTQFAVTMICLGGMYLYSLLIRLRTKSIISLLKSEAPLFVFAAVALVAVAVGRYELYFFEFIYSYYTSEALEYTRSSGAPWTSHLLAYPRLILFSTTGIALVLLTFFQAHRRFRMPYLGLYILWLLIPLILLTLLDKKNAFYSWYLPPALAFMAAGTISRFPAWCRVLAICGCAITMLLHLIGWVAPFERWVDPTPFEEGRPELLLKPESVDGPETVRFAKEIYSAIKNCGSVENRKLALVGYPQSHQMIPLHYAMLMIDQRPLHTEWQMTTYPLRSSPHTIVVEIFKDNNMVENGPKQALEKKNAFMKWTRDKLTVVHQTDKFQVYCQSIPETGR